MAIRSDIKGVSSQIFTIGSRLLSGAKTLRFKSAFTSNLTANPTADRTINLPSNKGKLQGSLSGYYSPVAIAFSHFIQGVYDTNEFDIATNGTNTDAIAVADNANNPGVVEIRTGTTNSGNCAIVTENSTIRLGVGKCLVNSVIAIPILSDGVQRFAFYCGFMDAINTPPPTAGAYFIYSDTINSGKFQIVTVAGGSSTTLDTGVTVVAGTFYELEVRINAAATSAEFYINGSLNATVTTNIPSGSGQECRVGTSIKKSAGTSRRSYYCDRQFIALNVDLP
jgi:hypothetical protein